MQLLYDARDDAYHERIGSQVLYWLDDLDAIPLNEADPAAEGFLFAGARPIEDYCGLIARLPLVRDRPEEREPLLRLDTVPKFVQHIKWVQAEVGRGTPFVRPPRLPLAGVDLELTQAVLAKAQANHSKL